jgi:hypothetical protein
VRHISDSAKLMTDAVACPPIDAPESGRCQPNRELAVEAASEIAWICVISRQRLGQQPKRMNAGGVGERLRLSRADCFHGVVYGTDAR